MAAMPAFAVVASELSSTLLVHSVALHPEGIILVLRGLPLSAKGWPICYLLHCTALPLTLALGTWWPAQQTACLTARSLCVNIPCCACQHPGLLT